MANSILIAQEKNAKMFEEEYRIGWFIKDSEEKWLWSVWGVFESLEKAVEGAKNTIKAKNKHFDIFVSEEPLNVALEIQTKKLNLRKINWEKIS